MLASGAFNQLLNSLGQSFLWRKAYACPCVNPDSGSPRPSCPVCSGKGRLWDDGIVGTAGIVGRQQLKKYATFGEWDDGDTMLSIPSDSPLYAIGQYDRAAALNRSEPFSINFIAGVNDQAIRFYVLSIDRVLWLDTDGVTLVEGTVPEVAYGAVIWGSNAPPAGVTYSLTGRRMQEYFCYLDLPLDRPEQHGEWLPRRVALRRFDLYGR